MQRVRLFVRLHDSEMPPVLEVAVELPLQPKFILEQQGGAGKMMKVGVMMFLRNTFVVSNAASRARPHGQL